MCLDGRGSGGAVQQKVTVAGRWRPGPRGLLSFAQRKHILSRSERRQSVDTREAHNLNRARSLVLLPVQD